MTLFKNITNYFLILFVANAFIANSQTTITRLLDDFSTLKVYNGIEVELVLSSEQKLVITGLKSEIVSVKNTDNTLKLMLPFSLNQVKIWLKMMFLLPYTIIKILMF